LDEQYQQDVYWADLAKCRVSLRSTAEGEPICPVCGAIWAAGAEHAWHLTNETTDDGLVVVMPSWSICMQCETEFGNDDIPEEGQTLDQSWALLRAKWLARSSRTPEALAQLRTNLHLEV
jgi:hypothetical protein